MYRLFSASALRLSVVLSILSLSLYGVNAADAATLTRYKNGDAIPVTCVNRSFESGEHIMDKEGRIEYVPFPTCSETGRPLELYFGVEKDVNCTIDFIDDAFFHILEFYVHNDAPMTCRIPSRPIPALDASETDPLTQVGVMGTEDIRYVPLVVAVTGILQYSHLHVSNNLNVLVHAAPKEIAPGVIDAATAYSVSHLTRNTEIIIGDKLPLRISVRWYHSSNLPSGWRGVGGHLFLSTVIYCMLSAGGSAALCIAYYRGWALPKRLKSYGYERTFSTDRTKYNGYGYGVGNGYGFAGSTAGPGIGKQD